MPQLVVGGDDLTGIHQACRDVGDVALETHQGPGSGLSCTVFSAPPPDPRYRNTNENSHQPTHNPPRCHESGLTAGLAAPWAVSTAITEVSSWVTRLSKEVADTILSAKNLKGLLSKARRLFDDVAKAFTRIPAKVSEAVTTKVEAAKDLASTLKHPQYALAGLPGISMRQAGDMGKATPTVHTPSGGPKPPKTPRPNPNEGRWGVKLDDAPAKSDPKPTTSGGDSTPPKGGDGSDPMSGPVVFYPPKNATAAELKELDDYVAGCNRALEAGALSKTGRVATTKSSLAQEAKAAAAREKKAHPELYSGGKVAGHVPDTGWGRGPEPHEWQPMSPKVNSSLGGQNNRYPVGYKPTIFLRGERE